MLEFPLLEILASERSKVNMWHFWILMTFGFRGNWQSK